VVFTVNMGSRLFNAYQHFKTSMNIPIKQITNYQLVMKFI